MLRWLGRFVDKRVWQEILGQRRLVLAGLVCSGLAAAMLGAYAAIIKSVVRAVTDHDVPRLLWTSAAVVGLFGVRYFLARAQLYLLGVASNRTTAELRKRVFTKLLRLPISYFNDKKAGAVQSVLTNDINVYAGAIGAVRESIDGPVKILTGVVAVFILQPYLALAAMAVMPVMAWAIQRNSRKMKVVHAQVQADLATMTATMQETLAGVRVIKAFGAEGRVDGRFARLVETSVASQNHSARVTATLRPLVEFLGAVAIAAVVLVCGLLVSRDALQIEDLAGFIVMLDVINQGFKSVGNLKQTFAQLSAATDRIYDEVLDIEETTNDHAEAVTPASVTGKIEFRDVSFTYPDGTKALDRVSFTIEAGTSLALVGPSGAGKSTVADLLLRFYDPTEGQILLDGRDIRTLKGAWYRALIGVVPQQTFLFAGTVAENLRLGAPDASDGALAKAVQAAHAESFVDLDAGGLDSNLGERGVGVSGGEGQRLAIARALVRDPQILLLDEATSNLDAHSEQAVTSALDEAMRSRTTLFIAHRLTTAARADQIVVLRRGQVLETGTHDRLMQADGAYAGMFRAFTSGLVGEDLA
ncbi:MAG: ABC transporter ATP-binding protein [Fimbriimonadaceae bacterium]|nr:ABC transporter ATP-binding protein [Fimbriimonadaceae bacterium]